MCLSILPVFKFNFYASAAFACVSAASAFSASAFENEQGRHPEVEHHHFQRLVEELQHGV
jgi:hypothetical protein